MKSRNAGDKAIRVPQASRFFVLELYLEHYRTFSNPIALPHHQTLTSALSRETYFGQFPNVRAPAQNPFLVSCLREDHQPRITIEAMQPPQFA